MNFRETKILPRRGSIIAEKGAPDFAWEYEFRKKNPPDDCSFGGLALHPNFDTRDDCSKRVQLGGANRVRWMRLLPIGFRGKNRGMHLHRVQLLHAEVSVHPHRVQMHPV